MKTVKIKYKSMAIQMLRDARERLVARTDLAILRALWSVFKDYCNGKVSGYGVRMGHELAVTYVQLDEWMDSNLDGSTTLLNWVIAHHQEEYDETCRTEHGEAWGSPAWRGRLRSKLDETELALIDWMISELEAVK